MASIPSSKPPIEIWSPLPPEPSGVADYVAEQLETLANRFEPTLVVEEPERTDTALTACHRTIAPAESDPTTLRVYHVGNSPAHRYIYREALRVPGVVVLHEWNLHELLLGFAVTAHDFDEYRQTMRREHGERGSVAAETIASALGGKYWTGMFPLNADILSSALGVICLSGSTAAKVAGRDPGGRVLHLPHHALLKSHAKNRTEARARLGLNAVDRVVILPGLSTAAKTFDVALIAIDALRARLPHVVALTVGGSGAGAQTATAPNPSVRELGRVDLETLGDALLAADVVVALRFPSRGEASGVLMRALAAGRAAVVSAGSTADEDLPQGVVARVSPGPHEARELAAVLELLLVDEASRDRMERLARETALTRDVNAVTQRFSDFLREIAEERAELETRVSAHAARMATVAPRVQNELSALASGLGLAQLPTNVFEKLAWIQ